MPRSDPTTAEAPRPPPSAVHINGLSIPLPLGLGLSAFSLPPPSVPCTVILELSCHLREEAIPASAVLDDLPGEASVDYSGLSKAVYSRVVRGPTEGGGEAWASLEQLADRIAQLAVEVYGSSLLGLDIQIARPRALLFAERVVLERSYTAIGPPSKDWAEWACRSSVLRIEGIRANVIIGLRAHERREKQEVRMDLGVILPLASRDGAQDPPEGRGFEYKALGVQAYEVGVASSRQKRSVY